MRIRVLPSSTPGLDGVDLSVFHPGHVYEVDASVGDYLVVRGVAEHADNGAPALVVRSNEVMMGVFVEVAQPADVADDWEDPEPAA